MKKYLPILGVVLAATTATVPLVAALSVPAHGQESPSGETSRAPAPPDTGAAARVSTEEIASKVKQAGYKVIHSIEFEHGRYEVVAHDQRGRMFRLLLDPQSGELQSSRPIAAVPSGASLSVDDIQAKIEAEGFRDIYAIEVEHSLYEVIVRDPEGGGKIELFVHSKTGELLRHPRTGEVMRQKLAEGEDIGAGVTVAEILAKVRKAGYAEVYSVSPQQFQYEVTARDRAGEVVKLTVDPKTGEVRQHH